MSAPVWVLPCSTITSGAGLVSGSCAMKVRATPSIAMVSDSAGDADAITTNSIRIRQLIASPHRLGRRPPGIAAREQTPAQKRSLQRAIAVHAAAAESGGFAGRVEPPDDLAVASESARIEVGLETAKRLAGQDVELHRDQRSLFGIEDAMRLVGSDQRVRDL